MSNTPSDSAVFCRDCGSEISERAEICPECGIRQRVPGQQATEKSPGVAAVCSFLIPGLGQVYNGQIAKGIVLGIITVGAAITIVGLILAIPLWIFLIYDAYKVAERGSGGSSPTSTWNTPRTAVRNAMTWYADRDGAPENTIEIRDRFQDAADPSQLPPAYLEVIHDALDAFERADPSRDLSSARQLLE